MSNQEEILSYDVVIVGAGPAGLASAIQLKKLAAINSMTLSVAVLEKGSTVGAHIISGAVFEADILGELIPDWQNQNPPEFTKVTEDKFYYLTENNKLRLPTPGTVNNLNKNNYIISLSNLCKWLALQAENLGVEIYPGFAAVDLLVNNSKQIYGVKTNPLGIDKQGEKTSQYQPGIAIHAKQLILAEGCRGSLTKQAIKLFDLSKNKSPQTYGLGIKEIWQVDPKHHKLGLVEHTLGWPLDQKTYGGSFIYHLPDNKIAYGFVVGLDYTNPYLSPFEEAQRFKLHPKIKPLFENATRLSYGARAITEGGYQSIPKLTFPGGLIVGDAAGFLNVAKIKGSHNAIASGMLAAKAIIDRFVKPTESIESTVLTELTEYQESIDKSKIITELYKIRNIRPSFNLGLFAGLIYSAVDYYVLKGNAPWTFKHHSDHKTLIKNSTKIDYPKPDNKITFDRLSSVFLSNTHHNENQPSHLKLIDFSKAVKINYKQFHGPEQYYCPAGVYEYLKDPNDQIYLQINSQNCVHCKTCDIKDPTQNINWQPPEGGGGPNYVDM